MCVRQRVGSAAVVNCLIIHDTQVIFHKCQLWTQLWLELSIIRLLPLGPGNAALSLREKHSHQAASRKCELKLGGVRRV